VASVVCWGELLWDLFPDGPRLGGGAANVAYHLARLGERSVLVSRVGDDELGRAARAQLERAGVDTSLVQLDRERPTGTVRVELESGEPRFALAEQAAWDRIEYDPPTRAAIGRASALCYGTLAQRTPLGLGALAQALRDAPPELLRVCDLNVRLPHTTRAAVEAALKSASAVKLNAAEAEVVCTLFGVEDALKWLVEERGIGLVALTLGERGCELRQRGGSSSAHPGYPVSGGDRVGAGDAFTAVLAHMLLRAASIDEMAACGNRYAAFVASRSGAMPPIPDELSRAIAWE
jgi:fructokinase